MLQLQGDVEVPGLVSQVPGFCREVCQKLECCPYLFGPQLVTDVCPSACNSRPKSEFLTEDGRTRPRGRRGRKRRKPQESRLLPAEEKDSDDSEDTGSPSLSRQNSVTRDNSRENTPEDGGPPLKKRNEKKNWGDILPPTEIRTRGAKLPNFALQLKVRPTKKDLEEIERIINEKAFDYIKPDNESRPPSPRILRSKTTQASKASSAGRPSQDEAYPGQQPNVLKPAFDLDLTEAGAPVGDPPAVLKVRLATNPLDWTPADVAGYLSRQSQVSSLAERFLHEEVDGKAFMLLNYPTVQEYWSLRPGTAIQLCRHIEAVKLAFYTQFAGIRLPDISRPDHEIRNN